MQKRVLGFILFGLIVVGVIFSSLVGQPVAQDYVAQHAYGTSTPMATTGNTYMPTQMALSTATSYALPAATMTSASAVVDARNENTGEHIPQVQAKRVVIYTANLRIIADHPDLTVSQIANLAEDLGGWIVNSNTTDRGNNQHHGVINVRVPADQLTYVVEAIKGYAVSVTSEVITGQDVTNQYVDMAGRLRNLQTSEVQMQSIMDKAEDVEDVLFVFRELTQIRGDIESIQGQLSYYDEASTFSSVSVNVDPFIPTPTPRPHVSYEWSPSDAVDSALDELEHRTQNLIDDLIRVVILGSPIALFVSFILGIVGLGIMAWRKRR